MPPRPRPIVAIDGPAGAGKSAVSRRVAEVLGFLLVDTGAMYRAVALAASRAKLDWSSSADVTRIARRIVDAGALRLIQDEARGVRVELSGEDVSDAIRAPEIGDGASKVSVHAEVRRLLVEMQRQACRAGGVVLEGRDIGTVVFPDAEAKFFLTARPEVRARRRYDELIAKGRQVTFEDTLRGVTERDHQDETRAVAPLRRASDAIEIDSSDSTIEETVAKMVARVRATER